MNYEAIYHKDFFNEADGLMEWQAGKLRYGDALCAIAYAFGIDSFEEVRKLVPFSGFGRDPQDDGMSARDQLKALLRNKKREPGNILEIGSGRGEVSVSLAHLGYFVQTIEPSKETSDHWFPRTARTFFQTSLDVLPLKIYNGPAHAILGNIRPKGVDTVIMVESLEHILAEDFEPVYKRIVEQLRETHGRFIITNWIDYHPIQVGWYASADVHCRVVDDALYDQWSKDATKVVYREGSHLVLEY